MGFETEFAKITAHEHFLFFDHGTGTVTILIKPEEISATFPREDLLRLSTLEDRNAFVAHKIIDALAEHRRGVIFQPNRHEARNFG